MTVATLIVLLARDRGRVVAGPAAVGDARPASSTTPASTPAAGWSGSAARSHPGRAPTRPSKQALADASERHNAAGSQMDQAAAAPAQARQVTETAYEGLYYVRAARTAMGLDPGPELPPLPGQQRAGAVSEDRERRGRRPRLQHLAGTVGAQPALLPRRHGGRAPGAAGLVLRAVVAPGAGRRGVGRRLGAAVQLDVLRDVRGGLRRRVRRRRAADGDGDQAALDQGDRTAAATAATEAATTAAATSAAATSAAATSAAGTSAAAATGAAEAAATSSSRTPSRASAHTAGRVCGPHACVGAIRSTLRRGGLAGRAPEQVAGQVARRARPACRRPGTGRPVRR